MVTEVATGYGARLDKLRIRLGLTVTEFAEKADVKTSSMSLIIREVTKNPSVGVFASLSKNTNANLNWMAFGEGEMFNTTESAEPVQTTHLDEDMWDYLRGLEDRFRNLLDQLSTKDSQIRAKDMQIEKLLDLLGKPEGAIVQPLYAGAQSFESMMNQYKQAVLGQLGRRRFFLAQPVAKLVAPRYLQ